MPGFGECALPPELSGRQQEQEGGQAGRRQPAHTQQGGGAFRLGTSSQHTHSGGGQVESRLGGGYKQLLKQASRFLILLKSYRMLNIETGKWQIFNVGQLQ